MEFRFVILCVVLLIALFFEHIFPLRKPTQSKPRRLLTNLGLAAISAAIVRFSFYPIVIYVAAKVDLHQIGLIPSLGVTGVAGVLLSLILLDGTLYYWHWMLHKLPFLWRFHNVHHIDLDLDSSTAFRFHFGELAISTVFRSVQVVFFGVTPFALALFELLVTTFAQFHHSNVRLPLKMEQLLGKVIITPRLHGIHHSTVKSETDSNFGTIFSWWDMLHRSLTTHVPQNQIVIGVPSYRKVSEQNLWNLIWIPFRKQRAWKYPDGSVPDSQTRHYSATSDTHS